MRHPFDLRLDVLALAYREGRVTPREVIATLRERALALNPEFNAFIHILTADELEPYLAALDDVQPASLPLYGVPFAIKDNIDLAGINTTAACPAYAYTAEQDAAIVAQLIALGAIPLGKTNLDQFATGLNGTRSPYGACRNSILADYPSGGSSAGRTQRFALGCFWSGQRPTRATLHAGQRGCAERRPVGYFGSGRGFSARASSCKGRAHRAGYLVFFRAHLLCPGCRCRKLR